MIANRLIDAVLAERASLPKHVIFSSVRLEDRDADGTLIVGSGEKLRQYRKNIAKLDPSAHNTAQYNYAYTPKTPLRVFDATSYKAWAVLFKRQLSDRTMKSLRGYMGEPHSAETRSSDSELAAFLARAFNDNFNDCVGVMNVLLDDPRFTQYWDCVDVGQPYALIRCREAQKLFELTGGYKIDVQVDSPEMTVLPRDSTNWEDAEDWLATYVRGGKPVLGKGTLAFFMDPDNVPRPNGPMAVYRGAHLAVPTLNHLGLKYTLDDIKSKDHLLTGAITEFEELNLGLKNRFGMSRHDLHRGATASAVVGPYEVSSWSTDPRIARSFMAKSEDRTLVRFMFKAVVPVDKILVAFPLWDRYTKSKVNNKYSHENEVIVIGDVKAKVADITLPSGVPIMLQYYDEIMKP